ncbi:MAG: DUF1727 domain-containing protein [Clostridiaceae bacterium]|nr:DUF1727 domain-containing protein [Clostridiaceae bacterium]
MQEIFQNQKSILITGTNGKSTVAYILKEIFLKAEINVISNLQREHTKEFRANEFLEDRLVAYKSKKQTILILEIDEADFQYFAEKIQPDFIIVTNFSRNQMERYGELYTLRKNIDRGLELSPKSKIILCADDPLVAALAENRKSDCYYYGMDNFPARDSSPEIFRSTPRRANLPRHDLEDYTYGLFYREAPHCSFCGTELEYQGLAYANYGSYYCPNCQFRRPNLDLGVTALERDMNGVDYVFQNWLADRASRRRNHNSIKFNFKIPGLFNGYNAGAATLCALLFNLSLTDIITTLEQILPENGRFELLPHLPSERPICLVTASNPEAVNCALHEIMHFEDFAGLMISNDSIAGFQQDVSWLWDIFFEQMPYAGIVGVGGDYAYDLALRLFYSGVEKERMIIEQDHKKLQSKMAMTIDRPGRFYWLANKPARYSIRKLFVRDLTIEEAK